MEQTSITLKSLSGELTLADELKKAGVSFRAPCGGRGTCGKCSVIANGSSVLSCQTHLQGDVTVMVDRPLQVTCKTAAVDLGTTNVVVLLDGERIVSEPNVLQSYGADVITRIEASKNEGFEKMHLLLSEQVHRLTQGAEKYYIAGNTVMECFYAGINPVPIAIPPYTSPELFLTSEHVAPCVSGYVGGDIISGLAYTGLLNEEKTVLYVDIGTNGELAFGNKYGITTCACAAGPAFEYGCSGKKGTEVVDEVARLINQGLIGKSGKLRGESFLSQADIQSILLAKAAIRAGIDTILEQQQIDCLYLAGHFGEKLNLENAYTIGLLPPVKRLKVIGNGSLMGAQMAMDEGCDSLRKVQDICRYIDLTSSPIFQKYFLAHLVFFR